MVKHKKIFEESLRNMVLSRVIDQIELEYTAKGEAFFHVSGAGHEGIAVLSHLLEEKDWIHPHYRDKSLLLARGLTPLDYFYALFNKSHSHSHGRQMNAHMSGTTLNILNPSGPVGNSSLHAAGVAAVLKEQNNGAMIINNVGEGATFEGEFLESLSLVVRDSLPMLVVVEDNKFAISTKTEGKTFYRVGKKDIDSYMGIEILRVNGRMPHETFEVFEKTIQEIRASSEPKIIVFSVERLASHTNADNHTTYREQDEIDTLHLGGDPILNLITYLYECERSKAEEIFAKMQDEIYKELKPIAIQAQKDDEPEAIMDAFRPLVIKPTEDEKFKEGPLVMLESIREVLDHWLEKDKNVFLYGQDIEDPKGDVFGLTKGLSTKYSDRVVNSPLSESLIVGTAIGRALIGQRPVAFLQFADFLPLAYNQMYSELGSMHWRTGGKWQIPVIVLATCGGYKPGLGPFHAASMESIVAHIPGIDVFFPSNAVDAAGLLNAAFLSERPTVFFYPKNLLNVKKNTISKLGARELVLMPGKARIVEEGSDITLVGYGNTIVLCEQVSKTLKENGKSVEIIDLRTIHPLDEETVLRSVHKTSRLLVTHEDNITSSISSEIAALVSEKASKHVKSMRVARPDTYVPCNFSNQLDVLPSYRSILEAAVELLGGTVRWKEEAGASESGMVNALAIGSSPSDEIFVLIQWNKKAGEFVKEGELLAEAEADKSTVELKSSVNGEITELLCKEGDSVPIGSVIAKIKTDETLVKTVIKEEIREAVIEFDTEESSVTSTSSQEDTEVYIAHTNTVLGANRVENRKICEMSPGWTEEKIYASTGINERHWFSEEQDLVSACVEAAMKSLKSARFTLDDIDGIICATGTHEYQTPSLAAMVQHQLEKIFPRKEGDVTFAYDVSAACSGFIFVLSDIYKRVMNQPNKKFLLLTGECLSKRVDLSDYPTAPVFSDAATASIVSSQKMPGAGKIYDPWLETIGAPAELLMVPEKGYIAMDGLEVYKIATKQLSAVVKKICKTHNVSISDVDYIIPHQANKKIIRIVAKRLEIPIEKFYINIDRHGNSSSNTIPICIEELHKKRALAGKTALLIAFGGGFTFGGTIVRY